MNKALSEMMLIHAMYVELMPPNPMIEVIRQAINDDDEFDLTQSQTHDLWDDRSVTVERSKRETSTSKEGKIVGNGRKRG